MLLASVYLELMVHEYKKGFFTKMSDNINIAK